MNTRTGQPTWRETLRSLQFTTNHATLAVFPVCTALPRTIVNEPVDTLGAPYFTETPELFWTVASTRLEDVP